MIKKKASALSFVVAIIVSLGGMLSANPATAAYWRFEGGTSGNPIVTAASEVNNDTMSGAQWAGNENDALYSSDVAAPYIYDPVEDRYRENLGSMLAPAGESTDDCMIVAGENYGLAAAVPSGSWTLEMFAKTEDNGGAANFGGSLVSRIINLDGSTGCNGRVGTAGSGTTTFQVYLGSDTSPLNYASYNVFQDGVWHHLAYVADYDGTETTVTVFVDSENRGSVSVSGEITHDTYNWMGVRFGMANSQLSNYDWFFDDVRLSDGALTTNQFLQISDHGSTNNARAVVFGIVK